MSDIDLLEIAGLISYGKYSKWDNIYVNGTKYTVVDVNYNKDGNGLQAITLMNTVTNEYVIAYQGTDFQDFNDVSTDSSLLGENIHPQFNDALNYYNEMNTRFNGGVNYVCGNSLGGSLSNYVAVENPEVKSVTYNPAILPSGINYGDVKNICNYFGQYDPLTLVEIAAGYKEGIPGKIIRTRNNIPALDFLITNHVGYGKYNEETGDYEVWLKTGKVPIRVSLIDGLPFSVFSNEYLDYSYTGEGKKITLNAANLKMLENGVNKIIDNILYAEKYLNESHEIVLNEGDKFDARMEELTTINDDVFKSLGVDIPNLLNVVEEGYNNINPALKTVYDVIEKINSIPIASNVVNSVTSLNPITNLLSILPLFVTSIGDLLDSYSYLKRDGIPILFKDCDKLFDDGLPTDLKNHLELISKNQAIVLERLKIYVVQIAEVWKIMSSADSSNFNLKDISVSSIPIMSTTKLEDNKKFENIIEQKNKQLDYNYNEFSTIVHRELDETLNALYQTSKKISQAINDIKGVVKNIETFARYADVPMISEDDQFFNDIYMNIKGAREALNQASMTFDGVTEILRVASSKLDEILIAIKPYIKNAIFNNTSYNDVIVYNFAAYNIYESSSVTFTEIEYQLSQNESEAINILAVNSSILKNDMIFLGNQIKKATIF